MEDESVIVGKHKRTAAASLLAIGMVTENSVLTLSKTEHITAEIATKSRSELDAIGGREQWTLPVVAGIERQTKHFENADGRVALTWLLDDKDVKEYNIANPAAQRAAEHQPKNIRAASTSHVKQAIEARWKAKPKSMITLQMVMRSLESTC